MHALQKEKGVSLLVLELVRYENKVGIRKLTRVLWSITEHKKGWVPF